MDKAANNDDDMSAHSKKKKGQQAPGGNAGKDRYLFFLLKNKSGASEAAL
jgi:hypothetical protein